MRVFLSYARGDDEPFVKRLHADLTQAGFTVWFDRESLMSRGLNFHQEIKDAIRTEVDRVVYVGGTKAAMSAYVREEWQSALEYDHVFVTPIFRLGKEENVPGELSLLHCEDFRDDANYPAALAKLIASLRQPNPKLGALFAVPNLPPNFLGRPELMRRVRDALLVDLQKPQVITGADARVGMQGMGGIGKSVLAAALARNRPVRQAYPDGVVWIAAGQKLTDDDLLKRQRDLARHLGGDDTFASLAQGQGVLRQLLAAKAVLLVLDDVWRAADAQAFAVLGPRCRMLVTTRDKGILDTLHGELVPVSLFTEPEALQLLADAVNVAPAALPAEAREVARECGLLPLALALCGGMARKRGGDFHSVLERLRRADLEKIADRESINEQHRSIWRAMQASVEMLPEDEQHRFAELSVFATDQTVPEAAAATLWSHTGDLNDLDTEELFINLAERSLVQLDQKTGADGRVRRRFGLHDLLHDYAVRTAGEPREGHQKLLDAYRKKCPDGWHSGPHDGYFFENLVHHHAETGAWLEAEALTTDFSWLMRKCELGLLDSISHDHELLSEVSPSEIKQQLEIWSAFFREKAHILRRGNEEWPAYKILLQLAVEHADDSPLTIAAERWLTEDSCDWLWFRRIQRLPHTHKNPCLAVFEGHTAEVSGALQLPDGNLTSWSGYSQYVDKDFRHVTDCALRVWNYQTGACLQSLEGHTDVVRGVQLLANERLLSWSDDKTLRVWSPKRGDCLLTLHGHTGKVQGALALPDRRLLSWSNDNTLRLWDDQSGTCLLILEGHTDAVCGALVLADSRLLSWSFDRTLRLWDGRTGKCLLIIEGHTSPVMGALELGEGRVLSWAAPKNLIRIVEGQTHSSEGDNKLRLWNSHNGECAATFEGHEYHVDGALKVSEERLLSWGGINSLRLWDSHSGVCLQTLTGHTRPVLGALTLADGRLLSWSEDKTLRLWDGQDGRCLRALEGHTGRVLGALALADGRLLSWSGGQFDGVPSRDHTLRLWELLRRDVRVKKLEGHSGGIAGARALTDGRLLSWSEDKALRLWSLQDNAYERTIEGHTGRILGARAVTDGKLLSWSEDTTLRMWDSQRGACLRTLEGHAGPVRGALVLSDGRLLSWAKDRTLRIWDSHGTACMFVLEGHTAGINGALVLTDGKILSWCDALTWSDNGVVSQDNTLRLWDSQRGKCLAILQGHRFIVLGALQLANGTLLTWSGDNTLRLWEGRSGRCLATMTSNRLFGIGGALQLADGRLLSWSAVEDSEGVEQHEIVVWDSSTGNRLRTLRGHTSRILDVLELPDGRVLTWAWENELRVWDTRSGSCVMILEGHTGFVLGALAFADGRLLSRAMDETLRLWDSQSGACLEVVPEDQVAELHPDWLHAFAQVNGRSSLCLNFFLRLFEARTHQLRHKQSSAIIAAWNTDAYSAHRGLLPDGTAVVTQDNGQVCILKLYHGSRRVSLADAEAILDRGRKKAEPEV